jgi:hypothetical protein
VDGAGIVAKLRGSDRRSIGRSEEIVREVLAEPELFNALIEAMTSQDAVVRLRAADAAEKVTRRRPELLAPHKQQLVGEVASIAQPELRWHVAQMRPRLALTPAGRARAVELLLGYLDDDSSIERTFAMQALAELALQGDALRGRVTPILERLSVTGTAAMRSRGRRLVEQLRRG